MTMKAAVDERVNHDILEGRARSIAALFRDRVSRSGNREAFQFFRMGYASALAWILFVVVLALTCVQLWASKKWVHYDQA